MDDKSNLSFIFKYMRNDLSTFFVLLASEISKKKTFIMALILCFKTQVKGSIRCKILVSICSAMIQTTDRIYISFWPKFFIYMS